jgi:hypothetical protein
MVVIDRFDDPGIKRDPYLILLRQETRRHVSALTAADVRFDDVEVRDGK